ncbi:MAG: amidase [Chloroflexia bacterium]
MQDLAFATATELTAAIRERRVSPLEVLEAHLGQIRRHNPALNAVVTLDEEGARRRAREAGEALARGEVWGSLHGLPMTLKDAHSTAGMRTTAGYPPLAEYMPQEDGTVAARLKGSGAIIIGKTNVAELLMDIQSDNPVFGRTNNPSHLGRTSGGSSGGACAALASGMTPLEIGSDYAGSIRIPAHFCGVYGLKTTERRVSLAGHISAPHGRARTDRIQWCIGPVARSIEDLGLAYHIIAGADLHDPEVPPLSLAGEPLPALRDLSIAWAPTFPGVPVATAIREAIRGLAAELGRLGARVEERLPEVDFKEMAKVRLLLSRAVSEAFEPVEGEPPVSLADYFTALDRRDGFIYEWERFFLEWDALLCPVAMTTAFPHRPADTPIPVDGQEVNYWRVIGHCAPFNLTGHPSVVIPVGRDPEGLPIGVQIAGKRWGEERLLAIAGLLAELAGPFQRPPDM